MTSKLKLIAQLRGEGGGGGKEHPDGYYQAWRPLVLSRKCSGECLETCSENPKLPGMPETVESPRDTRDLRLRRPHGLHRPHRREPPGVQRAARLGQNRCAGGGGGGRTTVLGDPAHCARPTPTCSSRTRAEGGGAGTIAATLAGPRRELRFRTPEVRAAGGPWSWGTQCAPAWVWRLGCCPRV